MAAPGGLGHLTVALGLARRRQPRRDQWRLPVRVCPELIAHLEGDSNEMGQTLAIVGAAGVRCDAVKQRPGLCGAEIDFLETSEQFEALKHSALHLRRGETFRLRLESLV